MHAVTAPLLSIGVPTWNRCAFLEQMILSVVNQAAQYGLEDRVELVVSDNASSDATAAGVARLQQETRVRLRYHRNAVNFGAVKNVLTTLQLSQGQYWMFYGDDDLMVDGVLPLILRQIEQHNDAMLLVFDEWYQSGQPHMQDQTRRISTENAARHYFYYLGNAGCFAIKRATAQKYLQQIGLENFKTCWPQTQLAFLALSESVQPQPVAVTHATTSYSLYHQDNTMYTSWYIWETMLRSLYILALELRPRLGQRFFRAASAHLFSPALFLNRAQQLFVHTTLLDSPQELAQTRASVRETLPMLTPRSALPLLLVWLIVETPRPVKALILRLVLVLLRCAGSSLPDRLAALVQRNQEHRRKLQQQQAEDSQLRSYAPGDF